MIVEFGIVVLNWNHWEETIRCLEQFSLSRPKNCLFSIVENGSTNDSKTQILNFLESNFTETKLDDLEIDREHFLFHGHGLTVLFLPFEDNAGFAGGMNRGIHYAKLFGPRYYFLLNNDAIIAYSDICQLRDTSLSNRNALVGPIVYEYDNRNTINFSGRKWPHLLFGIYKDGRIPNSSTPWDTGYIEASAVLLPSIFIEKKLKSFGYIFDEGYFLYCEDVDLSLSAKHLGFSCLISPSSKAFHKVSHSSGGKGNVLAYYYITRNRIYLANKWLPKYFVWMFHIYYLTSRIVLCFLRITTEDGKAINNAVFRGLRDGYLNKLGKAF